MRITNHLPKDARENSQLLKYKEMKRSLEKMLERSKQNAVHGGEVLLHQEWKGHQKRQCQQRR